MKNILLISILFFSLSSCSKTDIPVPINNLNESTNNLKVINSLDTFTGYKVATNANQLGESYWLRGTPILTDYFIYAFQTPFPGTNHIYQAVSVALGDFNKDGYLDMFNPGSAFQGPTVGFSFLIWNPTLKVFENKNLFNDKSFNNFGGNKNKTVPVDLNKDGYMDYVIFDNGDEGIRNSPDEPIRIVLSDGKGGYDLKAIETSETETYVRPTGETSLIGWKKESGDVGDLNGDGIPDLFINCNVVSYIYWGISNFPYFTKTNRAMMLAENQIYGNIGDNGFGENCSHCAAYSFNSLIEDVNKDGKNDIIIGTIEVPNDSKDIPFPTHQRILFNQGSGKFNNNNIKELPDYKPEINYSQGNRPENQDYVVDDINGDGLNDIIALNSFGTSSWDIFVYIQQPNGSYVINYDIVKTNGTPREGWKPRLMYADYNGDGKKDIGYVDMNFGMILYKNSVLPKKTVYIRTGNQFIEQDFFQFDLYAKSILPILK